MPTTKVRFASKKASWRVSPGIFVTRLWDVVINMGIPLASNSARNRTPSSYLRASGSKKTRFGMKTLTLSPHQADLRTVDQQSIGISMPLPRHPCALRIQPTLVKVGVGTTFLRTSNAYFTAWSALIISRAELYRRFGLEWVALRMMRHNEAYWLDPPIVLSKCGRCFNSRPFNIQAHINPTP